MTIFYFLSPGQPAVSSKPLIYRYSCFLTFSFKCHIGISIFICPKLSSCFPITDFFFQVPHNRIWHGLNNKFLFLFPVMEVVSLRSRHLWIFVWWEFSSWFADEVLFMVFSLYPYMEERREEASCLCVSSYKGTNPIMRLHLTDQMTSQSPHFQTPSNWWL